MTSEQAAAAAAAAQIRTRFGIDDVALGLVLGSGWIGAAKGLGQLVGEVPLTELPGFKPPSVPGHGGTLRLISVPSGSVVAVFSGRTHLYEGYGAHAVAQHVRTIAALGATRVVLTNGAGALDPTWTPGTVALISDHINLSGATPLVGAQFVDMTDAYAAHLRYVARQLDPSLAEGVYCQFRGPAYETPAEVQMAGRLGARLVGMSTAIETIAARALGLEVLGLSLVTNLAAGMSGAALSHEEVIATGDDAGMRLHRLLSGLIVRLTTAGAGE